MPRTKLSGFLHFALALAVPGTALPQTEGNLEHERALVEQYCVVCHGEETQLGAFSWSSVELAHPERNAEQAEQIIRKLRAGMMPPPGMPRPEEAELAALAESLEERIDGAAASSPKAAPPALHRVNRREYRNSIRDLLDLEIDVDALLPPDGRTGNFDNMADALTVTPALMQAYIRAADKISRVAVGDPGSSTGHDEVRRSQSSEPDEARRRDGLSGRAAAPRSPTTFPPTGSTFSRWSSTTTTRASSSARTFPSRCRARRSRSPSMESASPSSRSIRSRKRPQP